MLVDILVAVGEKGGVENIINMTVPYLQRQGMEVRIIQLISSGVVWVEEGIPYYTLLEGLEGHTLAELSDCYAIFLEKEGVPDCILATAWPSMCFVARKASLLLNNTEIRIISWLHAPVKRYEDAGYGSYDLLELADAHFAISQSIYEDILEHLPDSKVEYVYNPVDFEKCMQAESGHSMSRRHRLYFVGRVSEEKRLDVIIQGVAAAGDAWELFVIGDDDNRYGMNMKQLAQILDMSERIHWLGWKKNPWSFVKGADALVLASEYEGFPLVAIEAQANGLPVISTPVSGITELIISGVNGYIFPFGDWKRLSDILYGISVKTISPFDPVACREKAARFEKNIAVKDFFDKLCNMLNEINTFHNPEQKRSTRISSEENQYMTRQQIYNTNIQLQSIAHQIIYSCHTQNYDRVVRLFTDLTSNLMLVLDSVFADISFYNQEMEIVNPEGINASLQDILTAQENKDYVLLADLLDLQLVPFLQSLQGAVRCYDASSTNPDLWERNMKVLEAKDHTLWKEVMAYHEQYEKANAEGTWKGVHHLEDTNSGAYTLAGEDNRGIYYYHSNVNPMIEAANFARYYYNPGCEEYVVWGLGLGYHIRELLKQDDGIQLTVYESDMDVIYHCLMAVETSTYLALPNVSLVYDPEFTKIIHTLEHIKENFILHSPSLRHITNEHIREQMEMFFIRDSGKRNAAILFDSNSRENFRNYDGYSVDCRTY